MTYLPQNHCKACQTLSSKVQPAIRSGTHLAPQMWKVFQDQLITGLSSFLLSLDITSQAGLRPLVSQQLPYTGVLRTKFLLGTKELEPGNLLEWNKGRTGMSTLSQFSQLRSDSRKRGYVG